MKRLPQEHNQFGSVKPANAGGSQDCIACEAMLADVLDGTLSAEEQARFDRHLASCPSCSQMLADVRRGAAWLELLHSAQPEPPASLMDRILAQTGTMVSESSQEQSTTAPFGLASSPSSVAVSPELARTGKMLSFPGRFAAAFRGDAVRQTLLQPRLAMTAAMAFFSIGLTLSLTGVRLNQIHARDLRPSNLRRTFYQANAHVIRYVDNLQQVYELESRVRDLQRANEGSDSTPVGQPSGSGPENQPDQNPAQPKHIRPRSGSGRSQSSRSGSRLTLAAYLPSGSVSSFSPIEVQEGELL